jgi:nucleoside triphosphate diphosphatase
MAGKGTVGPGMERLAGIMRRLRAPDGGCPWDLEQDFESIAPFTIEEAYEVADAIARRDWAGLKGELGDLLFQAVYHAQMAEEAGHFDLGGVIGAISDKMVARHPHVFGEAEQRSAASQTEAWEAQKAAERAARAQGGVLDDVPLALPGLTRAVKLQKRAARVGFDWPETAQVVEKIAEEARELVAARERQSAAEVEEEFGDLLFVIANLARHLDVEPEAALRAANEKFTRRFRTIEAALASQGRRPQDSTLAEMDALWDAAKAAEKKVSGRAPGRAASSGGAARAIFQASHSR